MGIMYQDNLQFVFSVRKKKVLKESYRMFNYNAFRLWDLETGKNIATVKTNSSVRTCNFSFSAYQAAYTTDKAMGHPCEVIFLYSLLTIYYYICDIEHFRAYAL